MKKNIPLLKRLRTRFLRMKHPKHFNMKVIAAKTNCGAAMCLIGHTFDLAGYKMLKRAYPDPEVLATLDFDFIRPNGSRVDDPASEAAELWGMEYENAMLVFNDYSLKTPKQAVGRIEQLITNRGRISR